MRRREPEEDREEMDTKPSTDTQRFLWGVRAAGGAIHLGVFESYKQLDCLKAKTFLDRA